VQRQPGDVTLAWTFMGDTCADVPSVKGVRVSIPGEALANDGYYPCQSAGFAGIELHDFHGGAYAYTVTAYGYANETLFVGGGNFVIDGDVRVNVDLTPVGGKTSYAYINWSFPPSSGVSNPSCAQAGVRYVDARIDGGSWTRLDCAAGELSTSGVKTPLLDPGTHTLELVAVDQYDYPYYRVQGSLTTFASRPVSVEYRLQWAVGGAAVRWELKDGGLVKTCAQAGVQSVAIDFQDAQGNFVYGDGGDVHACDAAPILYNFLKPGTYRVYLRGTGPNGVNFLSNAASPFTFTVTAGVFAGPGDADTVQMFRAY
jgi:hypothetical protein